MKKFYLLLLVSILTLSCSKDDDDTNTADSINPPDWIHGTWKGEGAGGTSVSGLKFTVDDMILLGTAEFSHKNQMKDFRQQGVEVTVTENISPQQYDLKINYPMGTSINYSFNKVDGNTITWKSGGFPEIELQKQ